MELEQVKNQYRQAIVDIASKHNAEHVRIFGSVARGDQNVASDVDLLVHFNNKASLTDLSGLKLELMELLNCKVDVLSDNSIHSTIRDRILNEAIEL